MNKAELNLSKDEVRIWLDERAKTFMTRLSQGPIRSTPAEIVDAKIGLALLEFLYKDNLCLKHIR